MSDDTMLEEAINAARLGENDRARDLLTRLLRKNQSNTDYWFWMSAVVPTQREQIFCLENLLRLDPQNKFARRSLIILGALPPDDALVPPTPTRAKPYDVKTLAVEKRKLFQGITFFRSLGFLALFGALVGLILFGVYGVQQLRSTAVVQPTPDFQLTAAQVEYITLTPEPTNTPTVTPEMLGTPTLGRPTPLEQLLSATYTPTPMFVSTQHPEAEAYRSSIFAKQRKDWAGTVEFLLQAIDIQPEAADLHYYLGEAYFQLEDYQKALNAFTTALQLDDEFGPAYVGHAMARLALDPGADVNRDFDNALLFAPNFGLTYLERARFRYQNKLYAEALQDLAAAEPLLPGSALIPLVRAQVYLDQAEFALAKEQATLALELDITLLPAYLTLGKAHLGLGEQREAIIELEKYNTYNPDDRETTILLAQAYRDDGEYNRALFILDRLIEANAEDAVALYHRGMVYLRAGDLNNALDDLNASNRADRGVYEVNLALGEALIEIQSYGNAYFQLSETLPLAESETEEAQVYYFRALSLAKLEQMEAAKNDLEMILEYDPDLIPADVRTAAETLLAEISQGDSTPPDPLSSGTPSPSLTPVP